MKSCFEDLNQSTTERFYSPSRKRKIESSAVKESENLTNDNQSAETDIATDIPLDESSEEFKQKSDVNSKNLVVAEVNKSIGIPSSKAKLPLRIIQATSPANELPTSSSGNSMSADAIEDSRNLRCRRSDSRILPSPVLSHRNTPLLCCSSDDEDDSELHIRDGNPFVSKLGTEQREDGIRAALLRGGDELDSGLHEFSRPLSSRSLNDLSAADAENELDYSAVAGKMSDLYMGKRGSSFSFNVSDVSRASKGHDRPFICTETKMGCSDGLWTDSCDMMSGRMSPLKSTCNDSAVKRSDQSESPCERSPVKRRPRISDSWNQKKFALLTANNRSGIDSKDSNNLLASLFRSSHRNNVNCAPPPSPANHASPKFGAFGSILLDKDGLNDGKQVYFRESMGLPSATSSGDGENIARGRTSDAFPPYSCSPVRNVSVQPGSSCRSPGGIGNRHIQAMGDLGTPVTEVGSPAIFHDMEDIIYAGDDDEMDEKKNSNDCTEDVRSTMAPALTIQRKLWRADRFAENRDASEDEDEDMKAYNDFASSFMKGSLSKMTDCDDTRSLRKTDIKADERSAPNASYTHLYDSIASSALSARSSPCFVDETTGFSQSMHSTAMADSVDHAKNYDASDNLLHSTQCTSRDDSGSMSFSSARSGLASAFTSRKENVASCSVGRSEVYTPHETREQNSFRPLPDQSAFESSTLSATSVGHNGASDSPFSVSLVCPPTPQREVAGYHYGVSRDEDEERFFHRRFQSDEEFNNFSFGNVRPPPLMRQSSLLDNKLLLSQIGSNSDLTGKQISFHHDFDHIGLIGSGTFADVYLVRNKVSVSTLDNGALRYYAVKRSKRKFRSKKEREWLMAEVRTMKLIGERNCPYVVPFVRAWQEDSHFYVQMGFAERGTLKDILSHIVEANPSAIPDSVIWHVVHDVGSGLKLIHECGFVHLDIKPANLLVSAEGRIQIGDFGMVAAIGSKEDGHEGDTR